MTRIHIFKTDNKKKGRKKKTRKRQEKVVYNQTCKL